MADGIKFASNRINILQAEIARLKQFIDVSEKLFKDGWLGTTDGSDESDHCTAEVSGSATVGGNSGTARKNDAVEGDDDLAARELKSEEQVSPARAKKSGNSGTARKNDAVEGDDDLAARELKSEEQVSPARAKKNGSEPDRKTIFRRSQQ